MGMVFRGLDDVDSALNANLRGMSIRPLTAPRSIPRLEFHRLPGISTSLVALGLGAKVRIATTSNVDFIPIQIPLSGFASIRCGSLTLRSDPENGCTPGARDEVTVEAGVDWELLVGRLERRPVERRLEQLLGRRLDAPLVFEPAIDLGSQHGTKFRSLMRYLLAEARDEQSLVMRGMTTVDLERLLITTFLHTQPHNYTESLLAPTDVAMPRSVTAAREFLHANLRKRITLGDVADQVGVSERSLQRAFRRHLDVTPMAYLKEQRLQAARRDIRAGVASDNVTRIAMRYRFNHLGKFAAAYRQRFGESPSATRRS
ncbi:MAG: AraC family transcriptional regulator [Gammaproteobacteria bacterium]